MEKKDLIQQLKNQKFPKKIIKRLKKLIDLNSSLKNKKNIHIMILPSQLEKVKLFLSLIQLHSC